MCACRMVESELGSYVLAESFLLIHGAGIDSCILALYSEVTTSLLAQLSPSKPKATRKVAEFFGPLPKILREALSLALAKS